MTRTSLTPVHLWDRPVLLGTVLGVISAVGYTATNIFLRLVVHCDPIWVSCVKAAPTAALLLPWMLLRRRSGLPQLPRGKVLVTLLLAGLLGQLGGNVLFQWSLGVIGISLTVPLCLGSIILCSAVMGRVVLGECITGRTIISMVTLLAAIWTLSLGAQSAPAQGSEEQRLDTAGKIAALEPQNDPQINVLILGAAVLGACVAGFAYAVLGVAIRRTVIGHAPVVGTTWTIAMVGVLSLGACSQWRIGWAEMLATPAADLRAMWTAGLCNFVAFVALAKALQLTTLVYVNALNASQVAMAAFVGLWLFNEPSSAGLFAGIALTVVGLLFMPPNSASPTHMSADSRHTGSANRADGNGGGYGNPAASRPASVRAATDDV